MKDIEGIFVSIDKAKEYQLSLQADEGYWWYTLEANESICAESILLMHFLGDVDQDLQDGLARRILSCQRDDGTWSLYYNGPPDLSTTIECYWALKLVATQNTGDTHGACPRFDRVLERARDFIISNGGITKARVFTKIHLAQFGLVPWDACPAMPVELMLMPNWSPVNIYEFSSWARACIIPLLVVLQKRPVRKLRLPTLHPQGVRLEEFNLDELFAEDERERDWGYKVDKSFLSWERFFVELNKILKIAVKFPFCPFDGPALKKCEEWICEHIEKTEDIFPALAYGAIALSSLGHPNDHPIIKKAVKALKSFRQHYEGELPAVVAIAPSHHRTIALTHQQCCISPVWDTPWQMTALLNAGVKPDHPALLKAARWLISKQITKTCGDWKIKNPDGVAGGWSFEFENEFFPDVDDTIQVLHVLKRVALPDEEKKIPIKLGLEWTLSMQNDDGGWGAFDKNQRLEVVNKIPFSDHGACLDPSSPDVAGRAIWLLSQFLELHTRGVNEVVARAVDYLKKTQLESGAWSGRWGVNLIYGTWCALNGLVHIPSPLRGEGKGEGLSNCLKKATNWLKSIQHSDGGFSESPETYRRNIYAPYPNPNGIKGVYSQTAWALMGLIAGGEASSGEAIRAAQFLSNGLGQDGQWDEKEYTGTGFPLHFYIRYHGYRHFFPLLALAEFYRTYTQEKIKG